MSDLLRSLPTIKEKPSPRPPPNVLTQHRTRSAASPDYSSSSSDSSTSTLDSVTTLRPPTSPPPPPHPGSSTTTTRTTTPPIPWADHFTHSLTLPYTSPSLTATYHAYFTPPATPSSPLFVTIHGAGSSAMSFAPFATQLRRHHHHHHHPTAGVLSLTLRSHGETTIHRPPGTDFSIETLTADCRNLIHALVTTHRHQQPTSWPPWPAPDDDDDDGDSGQQQLPPTVLVGHSLGGAIAAHLAADPGPVLAPSLVGVMVLDVVEGTALASLAHMRTYLAGRPARFADLDEAVEWHVRTRTVRERGSAEVTVPGLLVAEGGTREEQQQEEDEGAGTAGPEGGRGRGRGGGGGGGGRGWTWRTGLVDTERWWEGWFKGLSGTFLRARAAKGLVLAAGTDTLDRELTIGQMQGKFQLTVVPEAGHFIHEDAPDKVARLAVEFFRRNDRSAMVLPPKVSDLLAQGKKV